MSSLHRGKGRLGSMLLLFLPLSIPRTGELLRAFRLWCMLIGRSQILLVLLSTGEAYIVDLRKYHKGRFELCDFQDEDDRQRWTARHHAIKCRIHAISGHPQ